MAEPSRPRKRVGLQAALDAVGAGSAVFGVQGALNQMRTASASVEPHEPSPLEQLKAASEVLADAATAAEALLPGMEKRRIELSRELTELESQIVRMRTIIQTAAPYRQVHTNEKPLEPLVDAAAGPDIDQVLFESSQPMKVSEIREQIEKRMSHPWAPSTISNHLSRGKADGRYNNDGGGWSLSHKGVADML